MAKSTVKLSGRKITVDLGRKNVADAVAALIKACTERQFAIGTMLEHANGDSYILARIKPKYGQLRAYLINASTGRARNSTKPVYVVTDSEHEFGHVVDLPCKKDKFYDPENPGEYIEVDEDGKVI